MHCVDRPAVILADGTEIWYQNNKRLRVGRPAVIHPNGTKEWYQNGFQFWDDDLPTLECANGTLCWEYNEFPLPLGVSPVIGRNSGLHRIGGPAVIRPDGTQVWWYYDVRHRQDGPAVERPDGTKEWWIRGRRIGCPETC